MGAPRVSRADLTDDLRFDDRVVLVTGGASGLGLQYSRDFARAGAAVVVNARGGGADAHRAAEAVVEELRGEGHRADLVVADVGVESEAIDLVRRVVELHGRIDVLVNNAGVGVTGRLHECTTEQLRESLEINVLGSSWTMREALVHMRAQHYGRIVNTGSGVGAFGAPGAYPYIMAKAAVFGMTLSVAQDNADRDICVNTISPIAYSGMGSGFDAIDPAFDADRLHARRVSPVVRYLAHERCALTGHALHAAGGRVARIASMMTVGYRDDDLTASDVGRHLGAIVDQASMFVLASSRDQYEHIPRG